MLWEMLRELKYRAKVFTQDKGALQRIQLFNPESNKIWSGTYAQLDNVLARVQDENE